MNACFWTPCSDLGPPPGARLHSVAFPSVPISAESQAKARCRVEQLFGDARPGLAGLGPFKRAAAHEPEPVVPVDPLLPPKPPPGPAQQVTAPGLGTIDLPLWQDWVRSGACDLGPGDPLVALGLQATRACAIRRAKARPTGPPSGEAPAPIEIADSPKSTGATAAVRGPAAAPGPAPAGTSAMDAACGPAAFSVPLAAGPTARPAGAPRRTANSVGEGPGRGAGSDAVAVTSTDVGAGVRSAGGSAAPGAGGEDGGGARGRGAGARTGGEAGGPGDRVGEKATPGTSAGPVAAPAALSGAALPARQPMPLRSLLAGQGAATAVDGRAPVTDPVGGAATKAHARPRSPGRPTSAGSAQSEGRARAGDAAAPLPVPLAAAHPGPRGAPVAPLGPQRPLINTAAVSLLPPGGVPPTPAPGASKAAPLAPPSPGSAGDSTAAGPPAAASTVEAEGLAAVTRKLPSRRSLLPARPTPNTPLDPTSCLSRHPIASPKPSLRPDPDPDAALHPAPRGRQTSLVPPRQAPTAPRTSTSASVSPNPGPNAPPDGAPPPKRRAIWATEPAPAKRVVPGAVSLLATAAKPPLRPASVAQTPHNSAQPPAAAAPSPGTAVDAPATDAAVASRRSSGPLPKPITASGIEYLTIDSDEDEVGVAPAPATRPALCKTNAPANAAWPRPTQGPVAPPSGADAGDVRSAGVPPIRNPRPDHTLTNAHNPNHTPAPDTTHNCNPNPSSTGNRHPNHQIPPAAVDPSFRPPPDPARSTRPPPVAAVPVAAWPAADAVGPALGIPRPTGMPKATKAAAVEAHGADNTAPGTSRTGATSLPSRRVSYFNRTAPEVSGGRGPDDGSRGTVPTPSLRAPGPETCRSARFEAGLGVGTVSAAGAGGRPAGGAAFALFSGGAGAPAPGVAAPRPAPVQKGAVREARRGSLPGPAQTGGRGASGQGRAACECLGCGEMFANPLELMVHKKQCFDPNFR